MVVLAKSISINPLEGSSSPCLKHMLMVVTAVMVQRNVRRVYSPCQYAKAPSCTYNTPAMGALNATLKPAAAPEEINMRSSTTPATMLVYLAMPHRPPMRLQIHMRSLDTCRPTIAPMWMNGPSIPCLMPADTVRINPPIFTKRVFSARKRLELMPER